MYLGQSFNEEVSGTNFHLEKTDGFSTRVSSRDARTLLQT